MTPVLIPDNQILTKTSFFGFQSFSKTETNLLPGLSHSDDAVFEKYQYTLVSECPFGQLPVLTVDGVDICQAHTIARYLAKEYGKIVLTPSRLGII